MDKNTLAEGIKEFAREEANSITTSNGHIYMTCDLDKFCRKLVDKIDIKIKLRGEK